MTGVGRPRAALLWILIVAVWICAANAAHSVADDVVETVTLECVVSSECGPVIAAPATKPPRPTESDYDDRLYRADLARAKRWGS